MAIEYLNNRVFEDVILRFNKAKRYRKKKKAEFDEVQLELASAFYILAKNIIRAYKFEMVDKDDALQEGVMICFEKLHRFDPKIGKAFNFCTTIILNHYRQLYRAAKNYNELKIKYHDHLYNKFEEGFLNSMKYKKKNGFKKSNFIRPDDE